MGGDFGGTVKKLIAGLVLLIASCGAGFQDLRPQGRSLERENGDKFCSAVVIRPGLVLTADHCIAGESHAAIQPNGPNGLIVARGDNGALDLALILYPHAEAACPCVKLADHEAHVDEKVFIMGYPRGITQVVTEGRSQGVVEADVIFPGVGRRLVLTASATNGNSGGGVFVFRNGEYQLVGILVEGIANLTFAIPLADIKPFLQGTHTL